MSRAIHKMRGDQRLVIVGEVLGNTSSAPSSTHSLGNIDVGGASADKNVILLISWDDTAGRVINSLTVGGVSLTQKASANSGGGEKIRTAIWVGDISSINGSKAISVTFDGGVDSVGVSGVAIAKLVSLTPEMTAGASTQSGSQMTLSNLAVSNGGIVVAVGGCENQGATATWGSLTERADVNTGSGGTDHQHTAAWDLGKRVAANETLDFTGGNNRSTVGGGFR